MYSTYSSSQTSSNFSSHPFANKGINRDFPSVREQVELCRSIASQLVANDNVCSKGASMVSFVDIIHEQIRKKRQLFFKRVKKAHTWEVPPLDQKEVESLENEDDEKTRQKLADSLLNTNERSATQNLSLVLDPRGRTHSLSSLKAEGAEIVEHDAVGPDVMSKLTQDLESPDVNPRAAELFAKRKSMAKDWEVEAKDTPNIEASNYIYSIMNNGNNSSNGILKEIQPALDDLRISNPKPIATIQPRPAPASYNGYGNTTLPRKRSNGGVKPDFSKQQPGKRFSLLDPDFFVPAVGSGLNSTPYTSGTRAPSPWKPQSTLDSDTRNNCNGLSRHSSMRQTSCSPIPVQYRSHSRNQLLPTQGPRHFAASPAPTVPRHSVNHNRQSYHENSHINGNGNNHYYNYFYQTLKQTNPYEDLPESVLL